MSKKLIFVSNFFNHHQKPVAQEFIKIYGNDYAFIAMTPFDENRISIGYQDMNYEPYVLRAYENQENTNYARKLIDEAECVVVGGVPVSEASSRLKLGKLTFMYSERFFKGPLWKDIVRFMKYLRYSGGRKQAVDKSSKFYLLCAGAFAAYDYNKCGLFKNKAYKWGYFPEVKQHDIENLISRKKKNSILWAGRFLNWKHPELALILADNLRKRNIDFSLKIIGSGEMQGTLIRTLEVMNLHKYVEIIEAMSHEKLREEMENSQIFLFTSNKYEGWGAVANESMNSGCAVVAAEKIGSVPYLIRHGENGLIFRDRDINDLTEKVMYLIDNPEKMHELGLNAYKTMRDIWSPKIVAERFVRLCDELREHDGEVRLWEDGPCSVAPVI